MEVTIHDVTSNSDESPNERLCDEDVCTLLEIVASVGTSDLSPKPKLHLLLNRVAQLIDAKSWLWTYSKLSPSAKKPTPIKFAPSRTGPVLRQIVYYTVRSMGEPAENEELLRLTRSVPHHTRALRELVDPVVWNEDPKLRKFLRIMGFSEMLYSILRLRTADDGAIFFTGVVFSRAADRSVFSPRDKKIVHFVVQHTLRYFVPNDRTEPPTAWPQLRPGLRELVPLLAGPGSFQEIAAARGLSVNSLKTYASTIYAELGVRDRQELVTLFSIYGTA